MKRLIKNIERLENPSTPLEFITQDNIDTSEGTEIMNELFNVMNSKKEIVALAAPQIGILKRVFCIRFDDTLKFFINPIITKKSGLTIAPETFANAPGKEYLIGRPDEITAVYYNNDFKYEDNKFIGPAARIFDQMAQLLDGVIPQELGLESDIESDGSLFDLSEDELSEAAEVWKKFVNAKLKYLESKIGEDTALTSQYTSLKFTESVINGRTVVMADQKASTPMNRAQRRQNNKLAKKLRRGNA